MKYLIQTPVATASTYPFDLRGKIKEAHGFFPGVVIGFPMHLWMYDWAYDILCDDGTEVQMVPEADLIGI